MAEWLEMLNSGAEGREFKSWLGSTSDWKLLSVNPAIYPKALKY